MATIPSKVIDRFKENLVKIQKVIEQARSKDINEADTVVIVSEILTSIFGYDKYNEVTREYAIKNTYCDLAVKVEDHMMFLIEVKAIGIALQEKHYQQALDYGANNGTEWIILTNALMWKVYKVKFEKPIRTELVCEFDFSLLKVKNQNDIDKLYILCKEGLKKNAIDEFEQHKKVVNRFLIGAVLQSSGVLDCIKKELKKVNPSVRIDDEEVLSIIKNDILKREIIDTPDALEANDKYNRILKKIEKKKVKDKQSATISEDAIQIPTEPTPIEEPAKENP